MKGRVLIISRYFPPGGGVGAFRAAKFVKYLPEFGWEPYVVSLPPERQRQLLPDGVDESQYAAISEIPEKHLYVDIVIPQFGRSLGDIQRLPILAIKIPDIIEEYNIDVVYHTSPPFYSLPSVSWISRRTEVPYILDLRDPWYINNEIFENTKSGSNPVWTHMNKLLENITVKNADRVTVATDKMESMYKKEYSKHEKKFISVGNGYDPVDYETDYEIEDPSVDLQMIYPGKFRNNTTSLVEAMRTVCENNSVKIAHFGDSDHKYTSQFYRQAEAAGLDGCVEKNGYAEFERVVANIRKSDIGLVITRKDDPTHVPQKTFDYIACDVPILALSSKNSELGRMLKPLENAYCVDHDDRDAIVGALKSFIETKPTSLGRSEELEKFTRKKMTEKLSRIFNGDL